MKSHFPFFALVIFLVLFFALPVAASPSVPDPPVGPVEDITTDFESLPDYVGLGSLVALIVVAAKMLKLPDGTGGYAALIVGVFVYGASVALPDDSAKSLFEALDHASRLLTVILGSQVTHYSLKYAKVDKFWKRE